MSEQVKPKDDSTSSKPEEVEVTSPSKRSREEAEEEEVSASESGGSDSEEESSDDEVPIGKLSKRQKRLQAKNNKFAATHKPVDTSKVREAYRTNSAYKKRQTAEREAKDAQKFHSRETKVLRRDANIPKRVFEGDEQMMHYAKKKK